MGIKNAHSVKKEIKLEKEILLNYSLKTKPNKVIIVLQLFMKGNYVSFVVYVDDAVMQSF